MIRCLPKQFWLLCLGSFVLAGWLGYLLGAKPKQQQLVTMDFYGWDIDGNQVAATDQHNTRLFDIKPYEATRQAGTSETLVFTPDRSDRYFAKAENVKWRTKEDYLRFIDGLEAQLTRQAPGRKRFWGSLFKDYRKSAGMADKNKFEYPVIFEKRQSK